MNGNTMKQKIGSENCIAIVACMATGCTIEEFEQFTGKCPPGGYYDSDLNKFLAYKGYMFGFGISCNSKGHKGQGLTHLKVEFNIKDFPAYVTCKSVFNEGVDHALYWDGEKLHDPSPFIKNNEPLEFYELLDWFPIRKLNIKGGKEIE